MFQNFRGPEILIIVLLIIVIFGWKRLPDAARSLGRSARVFKSEVDEMKKDGKASNTTVPGEAVPTQHTSAAPPAPQAAPQAQPASLTQPAPPAQTTAPEQPQA